MSPSDVIRKQLDERGIEHRDITKDKDGNVLTAWSASALDGALVTARENPKADTDKLMVTLGKRYLTPEQAIAATVGNGTDLSKRLREVHGLHAFAELFGFSWEDGSDWDWHDVACAMADAIDATAGVGTCRAVVCNQSDCVHNREYRCACTDLEIQDQECMTYRCRDIDYDEEEE